MKGALVTVGAVVALFVALWGWSVAKEAITGEAPSYGQQAGDSAAPWLMGAGDCFDDGPAFTPDSEVTLVSCDDPHDSEVLSTPQLDTVGTWTIEEVRAEGYEKCADDFEEYVAALPADADVVLRLYHPDEGRGAVGKGRSLDLRFWDVACVAWSADGRFGRD